jgi:hypothetical protein
VSRGAGLLAATVMILLAGCSGGGGAGPTPASSAPSASAAPPSVVAPSTPAGSSPAGTPGSTGSSLVPGANCLSGTWRLVRFIGLGEQSTYGAGQGGDVTVAFDNGRYTLAGEGKEPITVVLAGQSARLTVDGTVSGTYQPDGAEMSFTIAEATGEGTLQSGNQKQTLPMASIGQVIAPRGKATLACPDNQLLIALPRVRLEFER